MVKKCLSLLCAAAQTRMPRSAVNRIPGSFAGAMTSPPELP